MEVRLSQDVQKILERLPPHVLNKLKAWQVLVEVSGLAYARTIKGYHDEPLKGKKLGRRSIRLSIKWRAEYVIDSIHIIEFVLIEEIHPHDY